MTIGIPGWTRRPGRQRAPGGFAADDRGGVAVWFGIASVALLFFAGSGLDLARSINQQAEIQGAVDAAALAGAGAYTGAASLATATAAAGTYMTQFKAASGLTALTFTVTPGTTTSSGGAVTAYGMTVRASAPIANTLMAIARRSNTVGATATARNPVYSVTIQLSNFSSSAVDTDTISYYTVPPDGSAPSTTTLIYSNAVNAATGKGPITVALTGSQKLGFMLTNTTDGNAASCTLLFALLKLCSSSSYASNAYGGSSGSTHVFYSHMSPPSRLAYPGVVQNCSLQVLTSAGAAPTSGSCLSGLPAYSTVNCAQASGTTLSFYWNDMGGSSDDKDYNDAVYTVTCSQVDATVGKGLVLTN